MYMTPRTIVQIALDKARAVLQYNLEQRELYYDNPQKTVDNDFINSFGENCLKHLARLINVHRKGACHSIDLSSLPYHVLCTPAGYVICIPGMEPAVIHAIPEDIEDLLLEFDLIMTGLGSIAEEELIEFNARMMAGKIASATLESLVEDLLVRHSMEIKVICQRRGGWKCILSSTLFETSMAFFSDAEHIREDIERCANRIHEEEEG